MSTIDDRIRAAAGRRGFTSGAGEEPIEAPEPKPGPLAGGAAADPPHRPDPDEVLREAWRQQKAGGGT